MPKKKPAPNVDAKILSLRNQQVILDQDLAQLYGVPTKALLQAVKRHADRFPADFVFRLGNEEFSNLRSQIVTSSWGGRRHLPLAFTAEGVAMLSGVLQSKQAIAVNISVVREFVRLRNLATLRDAVSRKLDALEHRVDGHDEDLQQLYGNIQHMMAEAIRPKPLIGFGREEKALKSKG